MATPSNKKPAEGENETKAPVTSNDGAEVDATKDAPVKAASGEIILDDRYVLDTEGKFTPPVMSHTYKDVFSRNGAPLTGKYIYLGATTYFECRANKECSLVRGQTYDIQKLPKHEVIGNSLLRRLLVKADDQPKAEA